MTFDGSYTQAWMRRFVASAVATEAELTAFDQQVGDGDFGANLRAGADAVGLALGALPVAETSAAAPLRAAGTAFLDEVGGTSGPLFGLILQELAEAVPGQELDCVGLANGAVAAVAAVQRVGGAEPGDKTLLDALAPAAQALARCPRGTAPDQALALAARAALEGVRTTRVLTARRGRASYLGSRSAGVPDPGAIGMALLFHSAQETVTALTPLLTATVSEPVSLTVPRTAV
jgi:phosphoenolpyruvate---glycerone phosphotransferase subunit DhaL